MLPWAEKPTPLGGGEVTFQTLGESFESSEQEMLASLQSEGFKEGVAHFIEKRAPAFTGR
jgi:hypothetical protein